MRDRKIRPHVAPWRYAGPPCTQFWETNGRWALVWIFVLPLAPGVLLRTKGLAPSPARRDSPGP